MDSKQIDVNMNLEDRTVNGVSQEITTDVDILGKKSIPCEFTPQDIMENQNIIADMLATAEKNRANCIGLAANQIGIHKRIILFLPGGKAWNRNQTYQVMVNPKIIPLRTHGMRTYEESCLSFPDSMKDRASMFEVRRFKKIKVFFQNVYGSKEQLVLTNLDAVIVQHEVDHLDGVLR